MFEVSMDEKWMQNIYKYFRLRKQATTQLPSEFKTTRPIIFNEVASEKRNEESLKKLTSCQHTDFTACLIEKSVISFISFEDSEEAITV